LGFLSGYFKMELVDCRWVQEHAVHRIQDYGDGIGSWLEEVAPHVICARCRMYCGCSVWAICLCPVVVAGYQLNQEVVCRREESVVHCLPCFCVEHGKVVGCRGCLFE